MWKHSVSNKISALSLASVLLLSTIFICVGHVAAEKQEKEIASIPNPIIKHTASLDNFNDIILEAKAAYVYDLNTKKVLFEKNADEALPLASITKVMTGIIAAEKGVSTTKVSLNGETWRLDDLLAFTLISSSNEGAQAIANSIPFFVTYMNDKADELALDTLSFENPTGLDIESGEATGGVGSAKDVAKLFEYAIKMHPDMLAPTVYTEKSFASDLATYRARNTNTIIGTIPNLVASKTGYTQRAGGNLAIVFDRGLNEPVIAVVLGSTYDGRFSDIQRLASSTLQTYNGSQ